MNYSNSDWRQAVTNLIQKTSQGEISWELSDIYQGDSWNDVERSYKSEFGGKIFVVSETRYRHYVDEDEYYWASGLNFSIYVERFQKYVRLATAPDDLSIVASLFLAAERNFAYSSDALGGLLD